MRAAWTIGALLWLAMPSIETSCSAAPVDAKVDPLDLTGLRFVDATPLGFDAAELKALARVASQAKQIAPEAFARSADPNLAFEDLYEEPRTHRGKVVRCEGRLRKLAVIAEASVLKEVGLEVLFGGWIHDVPTGGDKPFYIVFTDLPEGIEPGENLDVRVSFAGWFVKKHHYRGADRRQYEAPTLIGRSPVRWQGELSHFEQTLVAAAGLVGIAQPLPGLVFAIEARRRQVFLDPPLDSKVVSIGAAAALVGLGEPREVLSLIHAIPDTPFQIVPEPPPPPRVTPTVAIKQDLSAFEIRDREKMGTMEDNPGEAIAYCHLVVEASRTPLEAFRKGARRDLTYRHLFNYSARYRGEVVHLEGRIMRINAFPAPQRLQADGIEQLYEGWIFDALNKGANPLVVVFTELPEGLALRDIDYYQHREDNHVAFDGWFFKVLRYTAAKGDYGSPLLIGRSPVRIGAPNSADSEDTGFGKMLMVLFMATVGGTLALGAGLLFWYGRSDRRHRKLVSPLHQLPFQEPTVSDPGFSDSESPHSPPPEPSAN
jgi:hypothetical protein